MWYLCGHFRITIFYFSFLVFPLLIFYIYPVGYCCMFFRFNFSFCVNNCLEYIYAYIHILYIYIYIYIYMFHIDIHIDNTYLYLYNIFSMLYIYIVHVIFYILCDTYMCMYILYIDVKCLSLVVVYLKSHIGKDGVK